MKNDISFELLKEYGVAVDVIYNMDWEAKNEDFEDYSWDEYEEDWPWGGDAA